MLVEQPLHIVAERIRRREISPVDYTEVVLQRIQNANPALKAFIQISEDEAMAEARRAEREMVAGNIRSPLHGIPFALKDLIHYAGVPTTANSRLLRDWVPQHHAHVTTLLKDAGAIYIGKLVTNEFACGGAPKDALHPTPLNPWNPDYITAGSSSGSAVAVAASMVPIALGTDTNGSIRNPASRCGIVGMKPTYGRVSRRGVFPLAPSLDHIGPMTRTVRDNALALQVLAGFDPAESTSRNLPVPDYTAGLQDGVKGLRIGVIADLFRSDTMADPQHNAAFERCLQVLIDDGAQLTEIPFSFDELDLFNTVARSLLSMEGFAIHERWLNEKPHLYGSGSKFRLLQGAFYSAADYQRAQRLRRRLVDEFTSACAEVDVIITASCYNATPRTDDEVAAAQRHLYQLHMPFNVSGQPALVIPTGVSSTDGMPLSVQLAGHPFEEGLLYRVAHHLEQALGTEGLKPPSYDATYSSV